MAEVPTENKDESDGKVIMLIETKWICSHTTVDALLLFDQFVIIMFCVQENTSKEIRPVIDYDDVTVKSCFDFRLRTSSFDLHLLGQHKKSRFPHLFKSKSDTTVKPQPPGSLGSPAVSPAPSPRGGSPQTTPRRRFVRIVRDNDRPGEEYENPNVVRRYTTNYWENCQQLAKKSSEEFGKPASVDLPYVVSGHTILKKQHSRDDSYDSLAQQASASGGQGAAAMSLKHTCFRDEVQVIEFDRKNKVEECTVGIRAAQLSEELCAGDPDFSVPADSCENDTSEASTNVVDDLSNSAASQGVAGSLDDACATLTAKNVTKKASEKEQEEEDIEIVESKFSHLKAVDGSVLKSQKSVDEPVVIEEVRTSPKRESSLQKGDGVIVRSLKKLREELLSSEGSSSSSDHKKSSSHHRHQKRSSDKHIRFDLSAINSADVQDTLDNTSDMEETEKDDVDEIGVDATAASADTFAAIATEMDA